VIASIALLAMFQSAAPTVDIVTAVTNIEVVGSESVRATSVSASGGAPRPVTTTAGRTTMVRDADPAARVVSGAYRIEVPAGAIVSLRVRCAIETDRPCPNATVHIEGVSSVTYQSADGRAVIENVSGNVVAKTLFGFVTVRRVAGNIEAASQTAGVTVADARGSVVARSTTGMIELRSIRGGVTATNTTGEVRLAGEPASGSTYRISTDIGHIRLDLPETSNATIEVNSKENALQIRTAGARIASRAGRRATVVLGNGSAHVFAETLNGGVDIGRRR
jgi:hypothetical protein